MSNCRVAVPILATALCSVLTAQESSVTLPAAPGQWLNSSPISMQAMRGKGAVLYFFEET